MEGHRARTQNKSGGARRQENTGRCLERKGREEEGEERREKGGKRHDGRGGATRMHTNRVRAVGAPDSARRNLDLRKEGQNGAARDERRLCSICV